MKSIRAITTQLLGCGLFWAYSALPGAPASLPAGGTPSKRRPGCWRSRWALLLLAAGLFTSPALYSQGVYSQPYTFTTLAGSAGYGSADGTGAKARFYHPYGVAVDSAGNVYVADTENHTIRKVTPAGEVSTWAGRAGYAGSADGTGATARFYHPYGVAIDSADNLYVADTENHTLRKITPAGVVSTLAGRARSSGSADGSGANAQFNNPRGLAVDSAGNVYVADSANHTLRAVTPTGVVSTLAGLAGSYGSADGTGSDARFYSPSGVAVDSAGTLYVADSANHTLRQVTPAGVVSTLAGMAGLSGGTDGAGWKARFNQPSGVAVDSAGTLYVADTYNHTIRQVTPTGVVSTWVGLVGASGSVDGTGSNARLCGPCGVALDRAGTLYAADTTDHTLRKVTPAAAVSTLAGLAGSSGSADGTGVKARFCFPAGVALDSAGNVYVGDTDNNTIRKVTPGGVVSTLAGLARWNGSADGTGANARFCSPQGVAVDSADTLYVADSYNHTIRKVTPAGVVSTLAGLAGAGGSADGTGSNARFNGPHGVAVDRAGNLYVADTYSHTIRKITPAGEVSTLAGLAGASGSADGMGNNARFYDPQGVAVDSTGTLYVADTLNHTIRKITPAGEVSTLAGLAESFGYADGTGATARFYYPIGVAVDSAGTLYVGETENQTIRKVTPAGVVSTLAGRALFSGDADGTGSNARFDNPRGVAVDSAGNLYVADTRNHTIRFGRAPVAPLLSLRPAGGQLLLSWPLEASNFVVEASSTPSLASSWQPLTNAVGTDGTTWVLTNDLQPGPRFFRLRWP